MKANPVTCSKKNPLSEVSQPFSVREPKGKFGQQNLANE